MTFCRHDQNINFNKDSNAGSKRDKAESGIENLLELIGEDVTREGIQETPARVVKAFRELTWGQRMDEELFLKDISKVFEVSHDQMIVVRNMQFTSLCEHHMLPFTGYATVAYIPNMEKSKVLGLSKLARLVEFYAARLQVQERMTSQIATALENMVNPAGVGVWVDAVHSCMCIRGVKSRGSSTVTSDLRGVIQTNSDSRAEFLSLARMNTFS